MAPFLGLENWFGDSNANCHFTSEICMFVPSNLYMKSKKVSYNCFFLFFSWKRMEKLKNIYLIYKFIIGCPLLSSHPVVLHLYFWFDFHKALYDLRISWIPWHSNTPIIFNRHICRSQIHYEYSNTSILQVVLVRSLQNHLYTKNLWFVL